MAIASLVLTVSSDAEALRFKELAFAPFDVEVRVHYVEFIGQPAQGLKSAALTGDRSWKSADGRFESRPPDWLFRANLHGNEDTLAFVGGRYAHMVRTPDGKTVQNFLSDTDLANWSPADYLGVGFHRAQEYGSGHNWGELLSQGWTLSAQNSESIGLTKAGGWKARIDLAPTGTTWRRIEIFRGTLQDYARDRWTVEEFQSFDGQPFPKRARSERIVHSGREDLIHIEAEMTFGKPQSASAPLSYRIPEGTVSQDVQLGGKGAYLQQDGKSVLVEGDYGSALWEEREAGKRRLFLGGVAAALVAATGWLVARRRDRKPRREA